MNSQIQEISDKRERSEILAEIERLRIENKKLKKNLNASRSSSKKFVHRPVSETKGVKKLVTCEKCGYVMRRNMLESHQRDKHPETDPSRVQTKKQIKEEESKQEHFENTMFQAGLFNPR
jgi:hypothetical protein